MSAKLTYKIGVLISFHHGTYCPQLIQPPSQANLYSTFGMVFLTNPLLFFVYIHCIGQYMDARSTYKIGVLIPFHNGEYSQSHAVDRPQGLLYAPAIQVAMDDVKKDKTLNFNIDLVWNDTDCDEYLGIRLQIWQRNNGVDVFVGPVLSCETAV